MSVRAPGVGHPGHGDGTPWPLTQWTEADLLAYVRRTARLLSWRGYHTRWSIGSDAGMPDVFMCRPPRVILAELKRERGKLTHGRLTHGARTRWADGQVEWLRDLLGCPGIETYWWVPSDAGDIVTILQTGPTPDMACVQRTAAILAAAEGGTDEH